MFREKSKPETGTDTKGVKPSAKCERMNMSYLHMETQKLCVCMYIC